jgi:hypothetical protein
MQCPICGLDITICHLLNHHWPAGFGLEVVKFWLTVRLDERSSNHREIVLPINLTSRRSRGCPLVPLFNVTGSGDQVLPLFGECRENWTRPAPNPYWFSGRVGPCHSSGPFELGGKQGIRFQWNIYLVWRLLG